MQTYQNMKSSGTPWLGDVPDDWDIVRPKFIFRDRREKSTSIDTHLTPSQKYGVLPQREYMELSGSRVVLNLTGSDNMKHVETGDFVIHLRSFQGGIEYSPYSGKVSNAYTILQPSSRIYFGYFKYALKSTGFISDLASTTDQLRDGQSIKFSTFDLVKLPLPILETQKRIADYLDEETEKIDHLIAKQNHLLELLEEKRYAAIVRAVTRGLNPNVELKESSIKWLGELPINWKLYRAKYLFNKAQQKPLDSDEVVTAFRDGEVVKRSLRRTDGFTFADKEIGYQHVSKGDLVIHAMDGFAGAIGVSKSDGKMSPVCSICRPIDPSQVDTEYFAQLVRTMAKSGWLTAIAKGIRERSTDFRWGDFANMEFPLPPYEEQLEIMDAIKNEDLKVGILKKKILSQVALLRERRVSLVSSVVTGKVKV